ncbi:MAG: M48 family metallopeptidase [Clostridia bacterium]|nr:M48 family metallopeptidase [Clostridia bacterium]
MQLRMNGIWGSLLAVTAALALLYLAASILPAKVNPETLKYFSAAQVERSGAYARFLRIIFVASALLTFAIMAWLAFGAKAALLPRWAQSLTGESSLIGAAVYSFLLWLIINLINLPFSWLTSFYWSHRWGFSTQTLNGWWLDVAKSSAIDALLFTAGFALVFLLMKRFPQSWWLIGAIFFAVWLVIQSYLWPVLVSPLFNRFTPATDPALLAMVGELSQKAGVPVDEVLIMDASSRTTKANAYFAGLGRTKRIVLYDTLLGDYPFDEVKAVVGHEMAHWKQGHIMKGLLYGSAASFVLWFALFMLYRRTVPGAQASIHGLALLLLFFNLVSFIGSPVESAISRQMEREADRVGVELTGDIQGAVGLQIDLAQKNLSDIAPPAFVVWYGYSHPDAVSRITEIKKQAVRP